MLCLNCGYCCVKYDVIIINPEYVKENLIIDELPDDAFMHKSTDIICPHFNSNNRCNIHHYSWYKDTPCFQYIQIEPYQTVCRIGHAIQTNQIKFNLTKYKESFKDASTN